VGLITRVMRLLVHPPARRRRLLACRTLEEQRAFYHAEWNTRRWRALFDVLLSRTAFEGAYDPAFFANVDRPTFARHFLKLVERGLTELPVETNYFLHQMLTGRYPARPDGLPPYLTPEGAARVAAAGDRLTLVDGDMAAYLRTRPAGSVHAFALSNIAEWLAPPQVEALFGEVVRAAAPGARVVFRNFVGWTEVPARWRDAIVEDRPRGEALIRRDRSLVQRRLAVCAVGKPRVPR
jgi:S-adenosylmethionine-diacylglycerol 3-amino-3-carboxypropyl transferase